MAANLPLPKRVFAHGWWTNEGEKISKSLGNVIDPFKLIEQYGLDQVRYFLLREVPFGNDGDFSRSHLVQRINSELANNLGNLVQRVVSFCLKNTMRKVPDHKNKFKKVDLGIIDSFEIEILSLRNLIDQQKLDESLKEIWIKISKSNKYIDEQAPWNLKNDNAARMNVVLYCLLESIRQIGILIQPIMPSSANKILDNVNEKFGLREFTVKDNKFFLNDKPLYLKAAFFEGLYPVKLSYPDSREMMIK